MKPYQKPALKEEKIKVNFFLNATSFLDDFNLVGDVYAQSCSPSCYPNNEGDGDGDGGPGDGGPGDGGGGTGTAGGSGGSAGTSGGSQP